MMNYCRITVLALLSCCILLLPDGFAKEAEKTSIWKVTSEDESGTVFLAGSIHMLSEEDHPLPVLFEVVPDQLI